MNDLALLLKERRNKKLLTQEEVAKTIGISRVKYNELENGTAKTISLITIRKLATYLHKKENQVMHLYMAKE